MAFRIASSVAIRRMYRCHLGADDDRYERGMPAFQAQKKRPSGAVRPSRSFPQLACCHPLMKRRLMLSARTIQVIIENL